MSDGKLISIDHNAAMRNAEDIADVANNIASVRKKLAECARSGLGAAFMSEAGTTGKDPASTAITNKIYDELLKLDKLVDQLFEVGEKMREISRVLAMQEDGTGKKS